MHSSFFIFGVELVTGRIVVCVGIAAMGGDVVNESGLVRARPVGRNMVFGDRSTGEVMLVSDVLHVCDVFGTGLGWRDVW